MYGVIPYTVAMTKTTDTRARRRAAPARRPRRKAAPAQSVRNGPKGGAKSELKKERVELRVTPSARLLIRRAMKVSGLTAGDLAYEGARRVLDEHQRMVLTGADRDAFLAALRRPPEPAERLVKALARHRALFG